MGDLRNDAAQMVSPDGVDSQVNAAPALDR